MGTLLMGLLFRTQTEKEKKGYIQTVRTYFLVLIMFDDELLFLRLLV